MSKPVNSAIMMFVVLVLFYFCCGIFVVKPTLATTTTVAHPGATMLYFRAGLAMPFITSADGIISDNHLAVNPNTRATINTNVNATLHHRMIIALPYSRQLYLRSTGGVDYVY